MGNTKQGTETQSYLFQVDILVNAKSNGVALEHLLHVLNAGSFSDYRINSGILIGQKIESALQQGKNSPTGTNKTTEADKQATTRAKTDATAAKSPSSATKTQAPAPKPQASAIPDELDMRIRGFIDSNKLIRLSVNKGRGVKLSIPCRVLQFDGNNQLLTVYHVDEKQVHNLKLFEIDDFIE